MTARRLGGVTAICLSVSVAVVLAADIKVTPLVAEGRVSASFAAPAAFTAESREVVKSGLPLTFTFDVSLRRASSVWFDRTLSSAIVASSVKYDNLTRLYNVSKLQDGRVVWSDQTGTEEQMRTWVTGFDSVPLPAGETLEPNVDYYVLVRVRTSPRRSFPLWPFGWPFGRDDGSGRKDFTFIR